jgi:cytochrome c peroxidase
MIASTTIVLAVGLTFASRTSRVNATGTTEKLYVRPQPAATRARVGFESDLDTLANQLDSLGGVLDARRADDIPTALATVRARYKRVEALMTYFAPGVAATLNGPAESDDPDLPPPPLGAHGGLESIADAIGNRDVSGAARQARSLSTAVRSLRGATRFLDVGDSATLDAARLEIARVMTLGVAGFDAQRTDSAIVESAAALDGVRAAVSAVSAHGAKFDSMKARAVSLLGVAAGDLRAEPRFDRLDRLAFIARRATPAARAVLALRQAVDSATPAVRRLWRPSAATPFDRDAFDVSALAPEYAPRSTAALVESGRRLFFDPRLSGPGTRSCSTCHRPSKAFADGLATAAPLASVKSASPGGPLRNTATLINAALQQSMFADERAGFVEDQIRLVLSSEAEMASSPETAAGRVGMGERELRVALAAYVRSLVALDSRFDRAVRGDSTAMSASERNGFNLFMGKARCGTCHFAPLFGGTMPPEFTHSELEIVGVPRRAVAAHARIDPDSGRANVDHALAHQFAFRVPTLRNVALTAPYMHNGVYRTLEEVIDFYDRGGGAGIGETLRSQTLDAAPLHLASQEKRDLVAFLKVLTDSSLSVAKP